MSYGIPHHRMLGTPGLDQFGLRVVQYLYPERCAPADYDSNWLVIAGEVLHDGHRWRFREACLLTGELERLLSWMKRMPVPGEGIEFIEPLLTLEVPEGVDPWTILVTLRAEGVPEQMLTGDARWSTGIPIRLRTTPAQVLRFVDGLTHDLAKFPPR